MKRRWLLAGIAALAALAVCLILFLLAPLKARVEGDLVLWYAESDCSAEAVQALIARCEEETKLHVEAVGFRDEQALAEACAGERPDLLWCSHVRAFEIGKAGGLEPLAKTVVLPAQSVEGFFPMGARLPVLLRSRERLPEVPESLEALLGSGEQKLLGAECWADLLYEGMYALGRSMSGLRTADSADPDYVRLHNLLGRAAYDGVAVNTPDAVEAVERGELAAAVVDSAELAGRDYAGLSVEPLPLPAGAEEHYAGTWMGFAQTKAGPTSEAFLRWLSGKGSGTEFALSLGLAPFHPGSGGGKTPLETALLGLGRRGTVNALDPGCSYLQNRGACEEGLRLSFDLLA